jgi:hypothetical protein
MNLKPRHAKHSYYLQQFVECLPIFIAERFVEQNQKRIEDACRQEGIQSFLQDHVGSYAKNLVGQWAAFRLGFVQEIMDGLQNGTMLEREMAEHLRSFENGPNWNRYKAEYAKVNPADPRLQPNWSGALQTKLAETLGEFVITTKWWAAELKTVRSECTKHNIVKGIMES